MRQIEVDLDVFSAIWASRLPQESCENQVLRRLLLGGRGIYSVAPLQPQASSQPEFSRAPEEAKPSADGLLHTDGEEKALGKIRWVDDILAALRSLGGQASLHAIYKAVEKRRQDGGRTVPRTIEAVIRRTLEDHSSDSANFRGTDLFSLVGRGEWALREIRHGKGV